MFYTYTLTHSYDKTHERKGGAATDAFLCKKAKREKKNHGDNTHTHIYLQKYAHLWQALVPRWRGGSKKKKMMTECTIRRKRKGNENEREENHNNSFLTGGLVVHSFLILYKTQKTTNEIRTNR